MKTQDNIQGWMTASLATKWAVDQLIGNAVTVHTGKKVAEYIKLADGTYAAPPGNTTQLIKNGSAFSLKERFGTTINFDANNKIASLTDIDGNTLSFAYTGGNLTQVNDAFNRTLTLHYDASNRIDTVTDSTGRVVQYGYDANNDLTSYTDTEGKVWRYGYESHRMTTLTNPLNITTVTNVYDSLGRVKTQTVPRQGNISAISNFYFSGFRNVEEGPTGNTLTYYYDDKGREYAFENALGQRVTKQFDGQDHIVQVTDPKLNSVNSLYDGQHNLIKVTNALTKTTQYVYDSQSRLTDTIDPLFHGSHVDYDDKHHPYLSKSGLSYNANLSPLDNGLYWTGATYYPNGLPWTLTDGMDTTTTLTYDSYGNPWTSTTGSHPAVTTVYNSIGWLGSLTDQVNTTTNFDQYNNRGQLKLKTDPLGKTTSFTYYDDGSLWTKTDRKGNTLTYSYTPSGKVDTVTYPDASQVKFYYDNLDNLRTMHDAFGDTTYQYYADNSLQTLTDPNGFTVTYAYDPAGNLTQLTYPGNKNVIYTYTPLNQLETVKIDWLNQIATYHYDDAGRLDTLTNFNGTITKYGYDNANRLTSLDHKKSDSSILASYQFPELDGNGNRKQIIQNEPLAPVQAAAGLTSYTYNDKNNRLKSAGANSFGYDDEGQLNSGYGNSYVFDYEHRLVTAGTDQYFYDGSGKRLKAIRNGVTTKYIYDASGNLLAEAGSDNVITKYYINGAGLMAMVTPSGDIYTYYFNATGSTVAMTDQGQNMVNKYSYDQFGEVLVQTESIPQPFKFVGQFGVMAEPDGLYYMQARYYNPEVGRFISEDPIGFEGGTVNLYEYAGNNPLLLIDPLGLCTTEEPFWKEVLSKTSDYTKVAAGVSLYLGSQGKLAAAVFGAISLGSKALENYFYSNNQIIDQATEIGKMAVEKSIPGGEAVKYTYSYLIDAGFKALDQFRQQVNSYWNKRR